MNLIKGECFKVFLSLRDTEQIESATAISLLDYFETSFLPRPTRLDIIDKQSIKINSFIDKAIIEALKTSASVQLETEDYSLRVGFDNIQRNYISVKSKTTHIENQLIDNLKEFTLHLIRVSEPLFAFACLQEKQDQIDEKYFEDTDYEDVPLLKWLNYFGDKEFIKRGGEAVFNTPHIKAERMGNGILIQVGDSPYDAYTPEGEELLVKASLAMPPYRRR